MNDSTQGASLLQSGDQPALGILTSSPSTQSQSQKTRPSNFALQSVAATLLPHERVAHCFRHVNPRTNPDQLVELRYTPPSRPGRLGTGSFGGLQVCGSIWHCPVCAARITSERRQEVRKLIDAGYVVFMVSFTLRHHKGDELKALRKILNKSFSSFKAGRWWQDFAAEYGIEGNIKAHELTYSEVNGFHPHLHILFTCKPGQVIPLEDVSEDVKARWIKVVKRHGGDSDWEHGADVTTSKNDGSDLLDRYFCKWGLEHEISSGGKKEGRAGSYSMNDLLELACQGDQRAADLWLIYAREYKGEKQLKWSNGLKDLIGLQDVEDSEIVEQLSGPDTVVVATLPYQDGWKQVLALHLRDDLRDRIGSTGGNADLLWAWLESHGIKRVEIVRVDLREL